MKKTLLFSIPVFLISLNISAQTLDLSWIDADAAAKSRALESRFKSTPTTVGNTYDLVHHRLLFRVDPAERFITGSITSYFRHLSEPPHTLTFNMHDSLHLTAIRYHGELLEEGVTHENNVLSITIPDAFGFGELDSIMVDYQGVPVVDTTGFGSFFTEKHGPDSIPVMYTLSEPYGAHYWWPCKQNLNDKIDSVRLVVTTPPEYYTASNGILAECLECEDQRVAQWVHKHPIPAYLIGIAVTNYERYSDYAMLDTGDSIEILNYVYPETLEQAKTETPGILEVFDIFNEYFGVYPYANEKYGHAEWNWGGGMEHQTMSFMGSFGHDLMAHELAHQWFGDYITCGSWSDIWLNEGFATYLTGLTYERMFNGRYWHQFKDLSTIRITSEPDGSVYCPDTTDNDRIFSSRLSYSKGGMVLHQLRWELGDDAFFKGMRNYINAYANGYARTDQFMRIMEAAADTSLQEYFNDWIYGEGYPVYALNYNQDQDGMLTIDVSQTPSTPYADIFEMHIPIKIRGNNADTTFIFHNTEENQTFTCMPGFPVQEIIFDPERNIISVEANITTGINIVEIAKQIRVYPNPVHETLHIEIPEGLRTVGTGPFARPCWKFRDITGKMIIDGRDEALCPSVVDVSHLTSGVYFLEVDLSGEKVVRKVLVR